MLGAKSVRLRGIAPAIKLDLADLQVNRVRRRAVAGWEKKAGGTAATRMGTDEDLARTAARARPHSKPVVNKAEAADSKVEAEASRVAVSGARVNRSGSSQGQRRSNRGSSVPELPTAG